MYFYSSSRNHVHVRPEIGRAPTDWRRKPRPSGNPQKIAWTPYDRTIPHGVNGFSLSPFRNLRSKFPLPERLLFGMSAAFRVPLRAFANPATAIRQTSTISIASPALSFSATRSLPSLSRSIASKVWSRHTAEAHPQTTSFTRCFSTRTSPLGSAGENGTNNEGVKPKPVQSQSRKPIALLVVLGLLAVGAAVYSEELKHGYGAARRSGRVVGTLAVCINE